MRIVNTEFGQGVTETKIREIFEHKYAEKLFMFLGAEIVDSFDYSDYEGATYAWDFNKPIEKLFKGSYTFDIDAGTLEHVFNFPIALKNCMEMTKLGGHFIATPPCNNDMGHGFYQISPELYFAAMSEENG